MNKCLPFLSGLQHMSVRMLRPLRILIVLTALLAAAGTMSRASADTPV